MPVSLKSVLRVFLVKRKLRIISSLACCLNDSKGRGQKMDGDTSQDLDQAPSTSFEIEDGGSDDLDVDIEVGTSHAPNPKGASLV